MYLRVNKKFLKISLADIKMKLIADSQLKFRNVKLNVMRFWNVDIHVPKNVMNAKTKYFMEIVIKNVEK